MIQNECIYSLPTLGSPVCLLMLTLILLSFLAHDIWREYVLCANVIFIFKFWWIQRVCSCIIISVLLLALHILVSKARSLQQSTLRSCKRLASIESTFLGRVHHLVLLLEASRGSISSFQLRRKSLEPPIRLNPATNRLNILKYALRLRRVEIITRF